ncbi:citrate/2-methylcitrate synthase [Streptomyces varsoviensis]|uniref:citrate synthase n=1 Tax=Streptomyces varsoviensis TaxID=67373 RepID=UPI000662BC0C|nr:citrate synthase [Streptomyces varsoviensis]
MTTREAAERLGVKPETVYAYVSRGQLTSHRRPGGRGSTFDAKEVDALIRRGGRREAAAPSGGDLVVRTGITLIDADRCYFRGVDATELAARYSYEEVADWLWTGRMRPGTRFTAPAEALAAARRSVAALPAHSGPMDRLRVAAIAAAAADPLRFDLSPDAVLDAARGLIPTLVDALPAAGRPVGEAGGGSGERGATALGSRETREARESREPDWRVGAAADGEDGRVAGATADGEGGRLVGTAADGEGDRLVGTPAGGEGGRPVETAADGEGGRFVGTAAGGEGGRFVERLWLRLTARPYDEPSLRVLEAALVLLIDHDLAASTLAARVAASARAHPYAVVSAGFGALDGPFHGAASGLAHRMLAEVLERGSAAAVVADHLRAGRRVPGLGHRLYPGEDPRARALFDMLARVPRAAEALAAAQDVVAATARHASLHANVDLALSVLSVATGMPVEAGETIFAVARTAGWIAHALEEYEERPMRMRPSGQYRGPRPPQPLP